MSHAEIAVAIRRLEKPGVTIADEHLFEDLQRPDYFFDVFHMNHKGRELFSRRLAALVEQAGGEDRR